MTDTENLFKIDARVIALNRTHNYVIAEKHQAHIASIEEVYFYDKNQRTHCCEFTPSYYLIHLYTKVIFTSAGNELNDHEQDEIFQAYEHEEMDNCYVHCHEIDVLEATVFDRPTYYIYGDPEFGNVEGEFESQEAYHDSVMEALREHFQANCPI